MQGKAEDLPFAAGLGEGLEAWWGFRQPPFVVASQLHVLADGDSGNGPVRSGDSLKSHGGNARAFFWRERYRLGELLRLQR